MNKVQESLKMNQGLKIKYINIILIILILSSLTHSLIYMLVPIFSDSWILNLFILIVISLPFIIGGILSVFINEGRKRVMRGFIVVAISAAISIDLTLLLYGLTTLPTSEWSFYIPLGLIYTTPLSMGMGAILGLIGIFVGIVITKFINKDKE